MRQRRRRGGFNRLAIMYVPQPGQQNNKQHSGKGDIRYGRGGQNAERARYRRDGERSCPKIFLRPVALKADEHANPDGDGQLSRDINGLEDLLSRAITLLSLT
jgi:hypothetical protein